MILISNILNENVQSPEVTKNVTTNSQSKNANPCNLPKSFPPPSPNLLKKHI